MRHSRSSLSCLWLWKWSRQVVRFSKSGTAHCQKWTRSLSTCSKVWAPKKQPNFSQAFIRQARQELRREGSWLFLACSSSWEIQRSSMPKLLRRAQFLPFLAKWPSRPGISSCACSMSRKGKMLSMRTTTAARRRRSLKRWGRKARKMSWGNVVPKEEEEELGGRAKCNLKLEEEEEKWTVRVVLKVMLKYIKNVMNLFEAPEERPNSLDKIYHILKTLSSSSIEAECTFNAAGCRNHKNIFEWWHSRHAFLS